MTNNLTQKQENFCQAVITEPNHSDAYRKAYDAKNMKPETINRNAKALMDDNKIVERVGGLRRDYSERSAVTVDSLTEMYRVTFNLAKLNGQPKVMKESVDGIVSLHGLGKKP